MQKGILKWCCNWLITVPIRDQCLPCNSGSNFQSVYSKSNQNDIVFKVFVIQMPTRSPWIIFFVQRNVWHSSITCLHRLTFALENKKRYNFSKKRFRKCKSRYRYMAEDRRHKYRKTPVSLELGSVEFTNNFKETENPLALSRRQ